MVSRWKYDQILSRCLFVSVLVKMGLTLSLLRVDFSLYGAQTKTLKVSSSEMEELKQKFEDLQGSSLEKLKELHSEVFSKVNWGRLVVFFNFADQLGLTEKGWELLLFFSCLLPPRFEGSYMNKHQEKRNHSGLNLHSDHQ